MSHRPARSRTPSLRAREASQDVAAPRTPPDSRRPRSHGLSLRKQATEASQRRCQAQQPTAVTPTPALTSQPPPSAQSPPATFPPSSPPEEASAEEEEEEEAAAAAPAASIEQDEVVELSSDDEVAAVDFDFRFLTYLDGKPGSITIGEKLSVLDLLGAVAIARMTYKKIRPGRDIPLPDGPFKAQLFMGSTSKLINSFMKNAAYLDNNNEAWRSFLVPFKQKALELSKLRRVGGIGDIRMELTVPFESKKLPRERGSDDDEEETSEEEDWGDVTSSRRSRSKNKGKKRKSDGRGTSSQKMRKDSRYNREIEAMTDNYHRAIRDNFRCTAAACKNVDRAPCLDTRQSGSVNGFAPGHWGLTDGMIREWNALVRDGNATVADVPVRILEQAMVMHEKALLTPKARQAVPQAEGGRGGAREGGYIFNGPVTWGSDGPPGHKTAAPPESSPPVISGDDDENIGHYMRWLTVRYPAAGVPGGRGFEEFTNRFADKGWAFSDLRDVADSDWDDMAIPAGFRKRILKHRKEFARSQGG